MHLATPFIVLAVVRALVITYSGAYIATQKNRENGLRAQTRANEDAPSAVITRSPR